ALGVNKTRSFLTTLCIIIGIVMVTLMNAVSNGMDAEFEKSMAMLGQNVVYVEKYPWGGGPDYKWWEYRNRRDMELSYVERIRRSSRWTSGVSASATRSTTTRYDNRSTDDMSIDRFYECNFDTAGQKIAKGRAFTSEELRRGVNVTVLGATLGDKFFDRESPLGKEVRIGGQRFPVIGNMDKPGKFLGLS